ncbi:hypothetical protein BD413DRAFT_476847 [Trametes elegans]|nr:hypothetical protein BD413DRAFT_476847 [Trametes elegans]
MSTSHLSLDDFVFPGHKPHASYELSYALGAPPSSSLYPHPSMDSSTSDPQAPRHFSHISPESAHAYLAEQPEAYLPQYYSSAINYPYFNPQLPPYASSDRPPSPRSVYTANPTWGTPEVYGAPYDATASTSTFLNSLQNVIDSSHTTQMQQNAPPAPVAPQQSSSPTSSSWTLSGSLDPTTGVFQRSVEHTRLRTAQACEKCRIRKAKCSGDHPACQRCISRGLQCEYAPERKMRGPNKNKRKSISKRSEPSPSDERRSSIVSVASTISSSSDASASDAEAAAAAAAAAVNGASRPSSRASPSPGSHQSSVGPEAIRPRSTTIAVGALQRAAEYAPPSPAPRVPYPTGPPPGGRQRPPPLSLDLGATRQFYPSYPNTLAQYTRGGEPAALHAPDGHAAEPRRPSLPPYLLEAYSRIALAHPDAQDPAAFHEPSAFVHPASAASAAAAESSAMAQYVPFHPQHL